MCVTLSPSVPVTAPTKPLPNSSSTSLIKRNKRRRDREPCFIPLKGTAKLLVLLVVLFRLGSTECWKGIYTWPTIQDRKTLPRKLSRESCLKKTLTLNCLAKTTLLEVKE
jgi:hypothetical protein